MITLRKKILEFDITGVLGFEINQHIDFYNIGVEEAYVAIKNNDDSTALSILKILKSLLLHALNPPQYNIQLLKLFVSIVNCTNLFQ